jgi:N utilization substance protein B
MTGKRRRARIVTLMALYEADTVGHDAQAILERLLEETPLPADAQKFARHLVTGVLAYRQEIDEVIGQAAPAWPLDQVAVVDRNILRLAIFETLIDNMVPVRAAINEAVELAKYIGSQASPKFVNGVLGTVSLMTSHH